MNLARDIQSFLAKKQMATISDARIVKGSKKSSKDCHIEARKCYMLEEDMQKIQKPLPFEETVCIRVSKKNTFHSKSKLQFVMNGPSETEVIARDESRGIELCNITAIKPGKYQLDVLWKGAHIRDSPFTLHFKTDKAQEDCGSNELDLQSVRYRLGVEHKFKLDCSDLEEGSLSMSVSPPTAAYIELIPSLDGHPHTYSCKITPLEIGKHEISLVHLGKHVYGSPFNVMFDYPGDASRCTLSTLTQHHKIDTKVALQVDTREANIGQLTAGVRDDTNNKPVDLVVSRTNEHLYLLEFDPLSSVECTLAVKYDNVHITGSPFKLLFNELAKCTAQGPGLESAQAGAWNTFSVRADKHLEHQPGTLKVNIHNMSGRRVETIVSLRSPSRYDVSYYPKMPGVYTVSVAWGQVQAPGSPFYVACTPPSLAITDRPTTDITLGDTINFAVKPLGNAEPNNGAVRITARDSSGKVTTGYAFWDTLNKSYSCSLKPDTTGKYPISVKLNEAHIVGSPFVVTVVNPVTPHLVRAWGAGLTGTNQYKDGTFTVDVSKAGAGVLSFKVDSQQNSFDISTTRNPSTGFIDVIYCSPFAGSYLLDVLWCGRPIPLSPFSIIISERKLDDEENKTSTLDKDDIFLGKVTSVDINRDWLKAWRSGHGKSKQKLFNGQKLDSTNIPNQTLTL